MLKSSAGCSFAVAMNSIECTKQKIRAIVARSTVPEDPLHSSNTREWLLKLKPDADEALQIAALGHDIERAFEKRKVKRADFSDYDAFKAAHARNSAGIIVEIMRECGVSEHMIEDVYHLVCLHETGGDKRSDIIKDADSLSFFEVNVPLYFQRNTWEEAKWRCIWGYKRLSENVKPFVLTISYRSKGLKTLVKQAIDETINEGS